MPYRFLCNDVQREGIKPSPGLASGLFCYASLHNIWYGIYPMTQELHANVKILIYPLAHDLFRSVFWYENIMRAFRL